MKLEATGKIGGKQSSLSWQDGAVAGDPDAVVRLREHAIRLEGRRVDNGSGLGGTTRHLSRAMSVWLILSEGAWGVPPVFDPGTARYNGDTYATPSGEATP